MAGGVETPVHTRNIPIAERTTAVIPASAQAWKGR